MTPKVRNGANRALGAGRSIVIQQSIIGKRATSGRNGLSNNATSSAHRNDSSLINLKSSNSQSKAQYVYVCAGCNKPIKRDKFLLKACDQYWHENCLRCDKCHTRLGELGSTLYNKSNMNLCRQDYLEMFGETGTCSVCNRLICASEMVMRAKMNVYHLECFACQLCSQRFCVGDRFYLCDNKIVCQYDYEEIYGIGATSVANNLQMPSNNHTYPGNMMPPPIMHQPTSSSAITTPPTLTTTASTSDSQIVDETQRTADRCSVVEPQLTTLITSSATTNDRQDSSNNETNPNERQDSLMLAITNKEKPNEAQESKIEHSPDEHLIDTDHHNRGTLGRSLLSLAERDTNRKIINAAAVSNLSLEVEASR